MSAFLFSCEQATYAVPTEFASLFSGHKEILSCSQGWEPGALNLAQGCAMRFRTPLVHSEVSRLLMDVENSDEECWSRFSMQLDDDDRLRLVDRYWQSYRSQLHKRIEGDIARHGMVMHIMVHTCPEQREHVSLHTPHKATLGIQVAQGWLNSLRREDLRSAHLMESQETALSRELSTQYDPEQYAQIRLSVHQDFFLTGMPWRWETIKKHLLDSLAISASRIAPSGQYQSV